MEQQVSQQQDPNESGEALENPTEAPAPSLEDEYGQPDDGPEIVEEPALDDEVTDVPVGEIGELVLRGPALMSGYHNMPTETANALRDGWLYTGDIARMDEDGYFYIVDRKKDMVLIGGFNVYPNEVEKVLMEHPAVLECAVAGIPHPEKAGQEALKAWIVLKPEQSVTEQQIIDFCKERLAPYAVPRRLTFLDALPKTEVGKILRRELVDMEAEQQETRPAETA